MRAWRETFALRALAGMAANRSGELSMDLCSPGSFVTLLFALPRRLSAIRRGELPVRELNCYSPFSFPDRLSFGSNPICFSAMNHSAAADDTSGIPMTAPATKPTNAESSTSSF